MPSEGNNRSQKRDKIMKSMFSKVFLVDRKGLIMPFGTRFVSTAISQQLTKFQIHIDIPRTQPTMKLFQRPRIQKVLVSIKMSIHNVPLSHLNEFCIAGPFDTQLAAMFKVLMTWLLLFFGSFFPRLLSKTREITWTWMLLAIRISPMLKLILFGVYPSCQMVSKYVQQTVHPGFYSTDVGQLHPCSTWYSSPNTKNERINWSY